MLSKNVRFAAERNSREGSLPQLSEPVVYGLIGVGLWALHRAGQQQDGGNVGSRIDKVLFLEKE